MSSKRIIGLGGYLASLATAVESDAGANPVTLRHDATVRGAHSFKFGHGNIATEVAGGFAAVGASIIGAFGTYGTSGDGNGGAKFPNANDNGGAKFSNAAFKVMEKMQEVCQGISAGTFIKIITLFVGKSTDMTERTSLQWTIVDSQKADAKAFDAVTPADLAIDSFWEALACNSTAGIESMKIDFMVQTDVQTTQTHNTWDIVAGKYKSSEYQFNIQAFYMDGKQINLPRQGEDLPFSDFWNVTSEYVCGDKSRHDWFRPC